MFCVQCTEWYDAEAFFEIVIGKNSDQPRTTVPFGFRMAGDGRSLEEEPAEQDILTRIHELKAAGNTTRQIADELNRQGYVTRRGTAWRFEYVAKVLRTAA